MKKQYVIGDIHGCIETLKALHSQLEPDSIVYSVGDLVDKGPNSMDVIDFCIDNDIKVIKGNHEFLYSIYMKRHLDNVNVRNNKWSKEWGGDLTIKSYRYNKNKIKKHLEFIDDMPYYYEVRVNDKNYFITHGFGLPYYDVKDDEKTQRALMSNRLHGDFYDIKNVDELSKHDVINVFGHDAFDEVKRHDLYLGIDTGCVYGNKLTAIELGTHNIIQVDVIDDVNYHN
jgi:serine/threonine protein phosphatase 1